MPRRRRKSSPFSLFSFQDIITSVTAVIILITLILTLDLVTRQPSSAAGQLDASVTALRSAVEQAEEERRSLEARLQQEAASTMEHARTTPKLQQRDLEQTREQVERIRQENAQLQSRQNAVKKQEDAVLARSLDSGSRRKELQDLQSQAADAERERKQVAGGNQLIFNRPSSTSKRPWLATISADLIEVLPFRPGGERHEFRSRLLSPCRDQMVAWVRERCSSEKDYFVLLVRPSGIENADALRDSLSSRGFDIGRDIVGANQEVTTGAVKTPK